jgi:hypothetical protein
VGPRAGLDTEVRERKPERIKNARDKHCSQHEGMNGMMIYGTHMTEIFTNIVECGFIASRIKIRR